MDGHGLATRPDGHGAATATADPVASLGALLTGAVQCHQAGDLAGAEQGYRRVLALQPDQPDALHLLGVLAHQIGQHEVAASLIGRAIQVQPAVPDFHANLGTVLQALGRLPEAADAYRHAVTLAPGHVMAQHNLGNVLYSLGQYEEAVTSYRQALAIRDDLADAHLNLSAVLQRQGKTDEAHVHADRAVTLAPMVASAHNNRGVILHALRRYEEAIGSYQRALALDPGNDGTHVNLGNSLFALRRLDEALAVLRQAIHLRPNDVGPYATLSHTLRDLGRVDAAIEACRAGLALDPANVDLHVELGNLLHLNGRLDEALDACRMGLTIDPTSVALHSNLIFALDLTPGAADEARAERRRWNERHARPLAAAWRPHANEPDPERRLRIGYVSADFRQHSAAYAILPILEGHDAERVEVTCYSSSTLDDDLTARFRAAAHRWREVTALTDADLAEQIRADGIDILVDLSGYSAGHRLLTFARRPAPIQISGWGYGCGTGLDAIDYLFADAISVPPETRREQRDAVIDLPSMLPYQPPTSAPDVAPLPALTRGHVTFGSMNRPIKLSDDALRLWARILGAVPDARLLLKFTGLDTPSVHDRILAVLTGAGVEPGRVELRGGTPQVEHLAAYGDVDVVLDPTPQSGGITLLEGLWMGVPAVTLLGESIAGRLAGSLLHAAGLPELVTSTPAAYIETAVRMAADLPRLAEQRGTLRDQLARSPVCNPRLYTAAVEDAYRAIWRRWCAGASGRS